jgi:GNAT superfamily N-acetyltransferase
VVAVRQADIQDAETVSALVSALLSELRGEEGPTRTMLAPGTAQQLLAMDGRVFGFLAFEDERPVGVIMLAESAALFASGTYGIITELYVVPGQRSSGIAKLLVNAASELGRQRGWRQLEVGAPSQPKWRRSLAFYVDSGFTEIGPRLKFAL